MSEWMTEERFLRHVKFQPREGVIYTLCIYDVQGVEGACAPPQFPVGYEFLTASKTLFAGVDFGCSPLHAIDSDACIYALMGFLCGDGFAVGAETDSPLEAAQRDGLSYRDSHRGAVLAQDTTGQYLAIYDANGPWAVYVNP